MAAEQVIIAALSVMFFPIVFIMFVVIILASLGKSMGVRKTYVSFLLKVFEYGQKKIDKYEKYRTRIGMGSVCEPDSDIDSNGDLDPIIIKSSLIERQLVFGATTGIKYPLNLNLESMKREFELADISYFLRNGMEAIIQDEVTKCFSAEDLTSWNLLTRTNMGYQYISPRLTALWCIGTIFRYAVLFPFRLLLTVMGICWLIVCTAFIGYVPTGKVKKVLNHYVSLMCYRILTRACSAIITYHNQENKAHNGIVVANHTSPMDVIVLSGDNCYAMVGQSHGGFLGLMQRAMARATHHIWFERSEVRDRTAVTSRLKEHVEDKEKLPILIFPEGTCINNTSVMMFKKGSFEIADTIYPVALKYDARFGDAFWDSSKHSMLQHLFQIMTSWALVCDVWYLPPMTREADEDAVSFANRVKSEIALKGGLVDLEWDGQLKRTRVKDSMKEKPQELFCKLIKAE